MNYDPTHEANGIHIVLHREVGLTNDLKCGTLQVVAQVGFYLVNTIQQLNKPYCY